MPLRPDDVVRKNFNSTRFRGGYVVEEVDAFLEEVVHELRRLQGLTDQQQAEINRLSTRSGADDEGHLLGVAQEQLVQVRRERDSVVAELTAADKKVAAAREAADQAELAREQSLEEIRARFDEDLSKLEQRVSAVRGEADFAEQDSLERVAAAEERAHTAEQRAKVLRDKLAQVSADVRAAAAEHLGPDTVDELIPFAQGLDHDPVAQASAAAALAERIRRDHVAAGQKQAQQIIGEAILERDKLLEEGRKHLEGAQSQAADVLAATQAERADLLTMAEAEGADLRAAALAEGEATKAAAVQQSEQLLQAAHVQQDEILQRANREHDDLLKKAGTESARLVADATIERDAVIADLTSRRDALEARVAELDNSQRDYRERLRTLVQEQLASFDRDEWER